MVDIIGLYSAVSDKCNYNCTMGLTINYQDLSHYIKAKQIFVHLAPWYKQALKHVTVQTDYNI